MVAKINPHNVVNAFRASGLVPWDVNAIDISKCLGTHTNVVKDGNNISLTNFKFQEIIGEDALKTLKDYHFRESDDLANNQYFQYLYKVWKYFNNESELFDIASMPIYIEPENDTNIDVFNIIGNGDVNSEINELSKSTEILIENNIMESISENVESMEYVAAKSIDESMGNVAEIFIDESIENIIQRSIDDCTKNNTEKSVDIKSIIQWPLTPIRKGTKKTTERMPYVITSSTWKELQESKQKTKEKIDLEKASRKLVRLNKAKEKAKGAKPKQVRKVNTKIKENINMKIQETEIINDGMGNTRISYTYIIQIKYILIA